MTDQRWHDLMDDEALKLNEQEQAQGWHFCPEWDGLLIGPGMGQVGKCGCNELSK